MKIRVFPSSFTIFHKLMATFLVLSIVLLASTLFLARWSFKKGFLDYPNALEQTRLQIISSALISEYNAANHNWHDAPKAKIDEILFTIPRPKRNGPTSKPPFGANNADRPPPPRPPFEKNGKPAPRVFVLPGGKKIVPSTALFDEYGAFVTGWVLLP